MTLTVQTLVFVEDYEDGVRAAGVDQLGGRHRSSGGVDLVAWGIAVPIVDVKAISVAKKGRVTWGLLIDGQTDNVTCTSRNSVHWMI